MVDKTKKTKFKVYEIDFIKKNYTLMTDKEIGDRLQRGNTAVMRVRKRLGLSKRNMSDEEKINIATKEREKPSELSEHDKILSAIEGLKASERFKTIQAELLPEEIEIYIREYANQVIHLDGIRPAELKTLHTLLMEYIRQHRYNKIIVDCVKGIQDGDEKSQVLLKYESEYNDSVKRADILQKSLDLERRTREDISKSDNDFLSIIRKLTDKRNRDAMGKEAAEISLAALEFRKNVGDDAVVGDQFNESEEEKENE